MNAMAQVNSLEDAVSLVKPKNKGIILFLHFSVFLFFPLFPLSAIWIRQSGESNFFILRTIDSFDKSLIKDVAILQTSYTCTLSAFDFIQSYNVCLNN